MTTLNTDIDIEDDEDIEDTEDYTFSAYDITSSPNDFNVATLFDYIERGVFVIPGFQRNYVWDIARASKLIESLILGLPVPQIFLYEQERNRFLVIDGQQRLMSIFFFKKERFPKMEKRDELRSLLEESHIPEEIFKDDDYFQDFSLELKAKLPKEKVKLNRLKYSSLGDDKMTLDLRTIRCVVIKQNFPEDSSAIFEIFNRLNTGGINLTAQEIRISLYHSDFVKMITKLNLNEKWREILDKKVLDSRMKDAEILLRCAAMLDRGKEYVPSMTRFLNQFANDMKECPDEKIELFQSIMLRFFEKCHAQKLFGRSFSGISGSKFNIAVFESVFYAVCYQAYQESDPVKVLDFDSDFIGYLRDNLEFKDAIQNRTTNADKVRTRLRISVDVYNKSYRPSYG